MERKNHIAAIDLGSANVVVAVGAKGADGNVDVRCVVSKPVEGVHAGKIENIELVSQAIQAAVQAAEQQTGVRITEAYAGISGEFVRCARHTDHVFVDDPVNGIKRKDVDALFDRMRNVQAPDEESIMERIPQNYVVDDEQEVKNPVGSFGKKLSSTFNFILCLKTPMQRLDMAMRRLGIRMQGVVSDALAVPEAVLSPDEKEEGVAVVDIGAGVTDVTVYYHNVVRYIASIPMGASAINRDIRTMGVPEKHVESLKLQYGSAVAELAPDDKLIRVSGRTARDAKDILLRNLATVIEARATDIAEFVQQEIKDSGYAGKLAFGIVLTGGSAGLKHIDELFRRVTGLEVRVAVPDMGISEASKETVALPAYAAAAGILIKVLGENGEPTAARQAPQTFVPPQPPTLGFNRVPTGGAQNPFAGAGAPRPEPQSPEVPPTPENRETAGPMTGAGAAGSAGPVGVSGAAGTEGVSKPVATGFSTDGAAEEPGEPEEKPRGKRDWGKIFQRTFDKINRSWSAAEGDEEI